jgi:hypothetical protein
MCGALKGSLALRIDNSDKWGLFEVGWALATSETQPKFDPVDVRKRCKWIRVTVFTSTIVRSRRLGAGSWETR